MVDKKKKISTEIDASDIKEYLRHHPDFLINNPDLFSILTPPDRSTDDEVVDFQNIMIEKIRTSLTELQNNQGSLIDTSRSNLTTQAQVHEATLALLDAQSLEHLIHMVTEDWPDSLHIDVIRICFENGHKKSARQLDDVTWLNFGAVDQFLKKNNIIQLRGAGTVEQEIFGPARSLIKAEALIRIDESDYNPPGILAFGSRDADMFYPGQGTELLSFLGKSFHKCLVQWLKKSN